VLVLDVHWKISNPEVFAGTLSYEELMTRAVPLPHPWPARAPSNVDALLIACMHRVAHHATVERLIWAYDVHLIAASLRAEDWRMFVEIACARGVAAVCRAGLAQAVTWFHSPVPADMLSDRRWPKEADAEPTAAYLHGRTQLQVLTDNLRGLPTWSARGRLVREHLFPPADYIRRVYAPDSAAPLALLYAWRVLRGAPVWLGQSLARVGRRTRGRA
jgi:hypothetical protein